ncbi:MAG: hypothetical protein A2270_06665 [Elusimicrobia bacterium RIFOXYA12_FULL_51_18]|nr:MAG: hypothetical protein A2270_06665 [Elusimicrobia bacterium RIFOXYA12_FULL_51_18]OGS30608.1 MAG: hypothetical protein A2218_05980 [Elusimicrobia bacterium RIFOXYA2_FULL_53_38]
MEYPLNISFKFFTFATQIPVTDSAGSPVCYVRQAPLKLKESVQIFSDQAQARLVCKIDADRVLDISANYALAGPEGEKIGRLARHGMASLWRANYEIFDGDAPVYQIREEDPWVKVFDTLMNMIPLLGLFSGYVFHPAYTVKTSDGRLVMRLQKKAAFLEGRFEITKHEALSPAEEALILYSLMMLLLLERTRG